MERLDFEQLQVTVKQCAQAKAFYTSSRDITTVDVEGAGLQSCPGGALTCALVTMSWSGCWSGMLQQTIGGRALAVHHTGCTVRQQVPDVTRE